MTNFNYLTYAIELRKNKSYIESRALLLSLLGSEIGDGTLYLNIAWSYDNQGIENDALIYYKKALNETLTEDAYFEAKFGLACSYRCLGHLEQAEPIFQSLIDTYPNKTEVIPFYALCLMSLNKQEAACKMLLKLVTAHPPTPGIATYQQALLTYLCQM